MLYGKFFLPMVMLKKIVTINKNAGFQALVQFASEGYATIAMQTLNGQSVYVGSDPIVTLTLDIQYSNLPHLIVKQNTLEARDYTSLYTLIPLAPPLGVPLHQYTSG